METDIDLQKAIIAALKETTSVAAAAIGITITNGIVCLFGQTCSITEKYNAVQAAMRVKGYDALIDEIEVVLPIHSMRTDDAITAAIYDALKSSDKIPIDKISIHVKNGHVVLEGAVEGPCQKEEGFNAIKSIPGIRSICNILFVKPATSAVS